MATHRLERTYGLSASQLLDAVAERFRLRAALEGAVAEVQMERPILSLVGDVVTGYEAHDLDAQPDFSIWVSGRKKPLRAETRNVRESGKQGGEAYRKAGQVVAYKVETQKTRASKGDPSSRYYDVGHFDILGVCLGKKTGSWENILYARTVDLQRHANYSHKLAVFRRVPLPNAESLLPWCDSLAELIRNHYL